MVLQSSLYKVKDMIHETENIKYTLYLNISAYILKIIFIQQ